MNRFRSLLAGVLISLALVSASFGYGWDTFLGSPVTWSGDTANMRTSSVSFPAGAFRDAIVETMQDWNGGPSQFDFTWQHGDTSVGTSNFQNEIWITAASSSSLSGAPAICISWNLFGSLQEADVLFADRPSSTTFWSTSHSKNNLLPYGASSRPFQTTALHELGHALGLNHENRWYNIMGQDWDHIHANGSSVHYYAGEDGMSGAVFLYGTSSGEDLGVVHWRYTGASGEYSAHARSRMFTSTGGSLSTFLDTTYNPNGEIGYRVNSGQTVQIELSYENNGATTQSTSVGFYLSTNDFISTGDQLLATSTFTLGRNTVFTTQSTITIPSGLASGTIRWVGAVVDRSGTLSETDESNNATYIAIRIN
ncbi:MAG: hypothetical protein KDC38_13285 [Planctomycetes bacterium]|nr:hypothetical protein [Planctomycetota bacterium]